MKPIIIIAGAAAAGGALWYMRANGLGPWAPNESALDAAQGFSASELSAAGATRDDLALIDARRAPPSVSDTERAQYAQGIRAFMASWPAGGTGASRDQAVGLVYGGRGSANVECGSVEERTQSAVPWYQLRPAGDGGAAVPAELYRAPSGVRYKITLARAFKLNALELAVFAPDAGRLWALTQGYRVIQRTPTPFDLRPVILRPVDIFVTPSRKQPINGAATVSGSGLVFAWDPVDRRWLRPNEWYAGPSPAARIQGRDRAGAQLFGIDQQCKRTTGESILTRAAQSRVKAVPV